MQVSNESQKIIDKVGQIANTTTLYKAIVKFFNRQGQRLAGQISKDFLSGQRLSRRTGTLARSIEARGTLIGGVPGIKVGVFRGPALAYAGIHERGGTIEPVNAKALAIPQKPVALTSAGVERFGGPRGYPGELKFIPFRSSGVAVGGLYVAESLKGDARFNLRQGMLAYLLVRKVRIEGKHYLRDGLRRYLPVLGKELGKFLGDVVLNRETSRTRGLI